MPIYICLDFDRVSFLNHVVLCIYLFNFSVPYLLALAAGGALAAVILVVLLGARSAPLHIHCDVLVFDQVAVDGHDVVAVGRTTKWSYINHG